MTRQPIQHSLLTHYTEQSLRVGGLAGVALGLLDAALGLSLSVAEQAADVLLDAADQRVAGTLSVALGLWRTAARRQTTSSAKQPRLRLTGILHSHVAVHARQTSGASQAWHAWAAPCSAWPPARFAAPSPSILRTGAAGKSPQLPPQHWLANGTCAHDQTSHSTYDLHKYACNAMHSRSRQTQTTIGTNLLNNAGTKDANSSQGLTGERPRRGQRSASRRRAPRPPCRQPGPARAVLLSRSAARAGTCARNNQLGLDPHSATLRNTLR